MKLRMPNAGPIAVLRHRSPHQAYCRSFITAFTQDPITISIQRNLPYSASSLYPLIADVDSYSQFLPFCMRSIVTRRDISNCPTHADLQIGWNGWSETFSSKVICTQNAAVTAEASEHPLFQHLKATWTLTPQEISKTAVSLGVEYNFSNPLYNTIAQQFAPQVAGRLVQAFEARAKEKLGQIAKSRIDL